MTHETRMRLKAHYSNPPADAKPAVKMNMAAALVNLMAHPKMKAVSAPQKSEGKSVKR